MTLFPLTSSSLIIQLHTWTAIVAVVLGAAVLWRRKGTQPHRWAGRAWVLAMLVAVVSSFFIHELRSWGPWSPIHILSLLTVALLIRAFTAARSRDIARHAALMKIAYYNALLLATVFTFMPGRIMHEVVFGVNTTGRDAEAHIPLWAWIVTAVVLSLGIRALVNYLRMRRTT